MARPGKSELITRIVDDADGRAALELIQRWKVKDIDELVTTVCPDLTPSPLTFDTCADALMLDAYLKEGA